MGGADVTWHAGYIDRSAAVAPRSAAGQLRRHFHAGVPHGIFSRRGVTLISPFLEVGTGERWQDRAPCGLEVGARVVEIDGGIALVAVRFDAWIETAPPFPLVDVDRAARTPGDRADMNIAKIDVPAVGALGIAAAGQGRHEPMIPPMAH
jgi:hypothetical protein